MTALEKPANVIARPDALLLLGALVLVSLLGMRIAVGHDRYLDRDELEHLNAAYFISQGETIYGSFFENHPPLIAWSLQPIVRSSDTPATIISRARIAIFLVQLGILAVAGVIANRLAGGLAACMAPILLLEQSFFYQKTLEIRPDVPGLLFFMLALERMGAPAGERLTRRWVLIGAYLCIAGLFTPKLIYAAAGGAIAVAVATHWSSSTRWRAALQTLLWIGFGGAIVATAVSAELARQGLFAGFIEDAVVQSLRMTIDDAGWFRAGFIAATARTDAAAWCLSILGVGIALRLLLRNGLADTRAREIVILVASASAGLLGLFLIEAPLPQYFLCFIPQCLIFASWGISSVVTEIRARGTIWMASGALGLILCLALYLPVQNQLDHAITHQSQLEIIDTVRAATKPDQRVFACWSGLYLTRLPAYRYFFLNSDVQRLLDPVQMERDLHAVLSRADVAIYLHDRNCNELPNRVKLRLKRTFTPHPDFPKNIFVRRAQRTRG